MANDSDILSAAFARARQKRGYSNETTPTPAAETNPGKAETNEAPKITCPECGHQWVDVRTSPETQETGNDDDSNQGNRPDARLTGVQLALKSRGFDPFGQD